jgi:lipocalin
MKKASIIFMGVIMGITLFLTVTSFTTKNFLAKSDVTKLNGPSSVEVTFSSVSGVRTFSMVSQLFATTINGTWIMVPSSPTSTAYHCDNVLTYTSGGVTSRLSVLSRCNRKTMEGTWRVYSGTGIFAGLSGQGKLMMGTSGFSEMWEGNFSH